MNSFDLSSEPVPAPLVPNAGFSMLEASSKFNGFYWPSPPYAIYRDAPPWTEPQVCEVMGLNGAVRSCLLSALTPAAQTITIQIPPGKSITHLRFSQFLRLTLKEPVHPEAVVTETQFSDIFGYRSTVEYHLHLENGSTASGQTVGYVETHFGLFVFTPLNAKGSVERVFIPRGAYLSVNFGEHIGQMLVAQRAVTQQQVEQAATEQKNLRSRKLGDHLVGNAIVTSEQLLVALDQQAKIPMIRVGEALTRLGYIDEEQLGQALEKQKTERSVPLGQLLVNMGFLSKRDLNMALARKMGYPVVDVTQFPIEAEALRKIALPMAQRLGVMPLLLRDHLLVVATSDPTRRDMLEELEFVMQARVIATLGDDVDIAQSLIGMYEKFGLLSTQPNDALHNTDHQPADLASTSQLLESMELNQGDVEVAENQIEQSDNSLVRLINTMIIEAHNRGVSDIHIETHPGRTKTRIRFRKDGVLSHYLELPHTYRAALTARLKIMADLDISERRKPQDGKIDFAKFSSHHRLELRIATIPTYAGLEDVVMRLLSSAKPIAMEKLGLSPTNFTHLREAVSRPYGMVLCVGPTGSGKTTTLHSVLGYLNTPQRKIWTAEDPIEITQPDLRQVQVNPKIDWTFAKALRSFLRADPDIIMVGEIRDKETAQIAIEASLTGHLVLSTLHTNSAAETVTRLIDMGMDPFNFADSLLAVLAQRLVRRLCPDCRTAALAEEVFVEELIEDYLHSFAPELRPARESVLAEWLDEFGHNGQLTHYSAPGCSKCQDTGLRGRVGIHELMMVTPGLRRLIQTGARPEQLQLEGMQHGHLRTLRQDGIYKVLGGQTTIEEVRANSNQ
ncbi:ATPase, T2SS/T4P/T4SS family [Rhodoferax sp.]|uniref:GspE/PulE family protein n=1 Tax=Rhodoferax sp. TaxID=50421 RepID=UPI0025FBD806|nr:ATPase, T2SS/T4P/T4SS family [Rhodoferax sp.]